jgi:hypothetical protein
MDFNVDDFIPSSTDDNINASPTTLENFTPTTLTSTSINEDVVTSVIIVKPTSTILVVTTNTRGIPHPRATDHPIPSKESVNPSVPIPSISSSVIYSTFSVINDGYVPAPTDMVVTSTGSDMAVAATQSTTQFSSAIASSQSQSTILPALSGLSIFGILCLVIYCVLVRKKNLKLRPNDEFMMPYDTIRIHESICTEILPITVSKKDKSATIPQIHNHNPEPPLNDFIIPHVISQEDETRYEK